ncbi:MAG TPA: hypothetical protein VGQ15_14625, partial [Gaiellaceae bacterium]|nr:hypothetical protein [Gaiellaceae bacterium]
TKDEAVDATRQVETLQKELKAIEDVDRADFAALERLGFGRDGRMAEAAAEQVDMAAPVAEGAAGKADSGADADTAPTHADAPPSDDRPEL